MLYVYVYVLPYIPQHDSTRSGEFSLFPVLPLLFSLSVFTLSSYLPFSFSVSLSLSLLPVLFTDWRLTWAPTVYRLALDFEF